MHESPISTFKSHIDGKNADVSIYPDRVEWSRKGGMGTGSKLALGAMTKGLSLAATGVSGKGGSEVIPVRSISSVTTKKDGMAYTKVVVICSGNEIGFRVGHGAAEPIKALLTQLMLGSHPSQQPQAPAAVPAPPPVAVAAPPVVQVQEAAPLSAASPAERIAAVKDLLDQGLISAEDFEAKRQSIIDSI